MAGKIRKISAWGVKLLTLCMLAVLLAILSAVLFGTPMSVSAAQEPEFRLDMDSLNLQKGVSGSLVVSLINAKDAQIIDIEGLDNFDQLSQSQRTSTSIINGVTSYREDISYIIMPKAVGQFTLKANIQYNGKNYETNTLQVNVREISNTTNGDEPAQDLFIKTVVSNPEAYLGEKIVVAYELYTRYNIENYGFTDPVTIDGVITKELPDDQLKAEYVYIDGNRYAMYEVRKLIIDPIKSGVCVIPSFNFQVNVMTSSSGFFSSSTPMYLLTEEKELTVKSLPSEGKPKNFSGIVGELKLDGRYSREELNYGDSLVLYITASGNCNLDGLKNIIGVMPGFSVYETQKNMAESVINNQYNTQKDFEVILVPEKTGNLSVPLVSISYFNPGAGKYEEAKIQGTTISVLGDMPQPNNYSVGAQTGAIETVNVKQVNYTAGRNDDYFNIKKATVYFVLIVFAFIVSAVVFIWLILSRKKQDHTLDDLYKRLMKSEYINEIYDLFNEMIKYCYKVSLKANSQNTIMNALPDANLAEKVADIMSFMESPGAREDKGYAELKERIKTIYPKKSFVARLSL